MRLMLKKKSALFHWDIWISKHFRVEREIVTGRYVFNLIIDVSVSKYHWKC